MGRQYDLFEYLVKDSKKHDAINAEGDHKYIIKNPDDEEYFWKSRANKDKTGNNTCHLAFEINNLKWRYKFLKVLIEEEIGDIYKPNKLGYLPHQIEH